MASNTQLKCNELVDREPYRETIAQQPAHCSCHAPERRKSIGSLSHRVFLLQFISKVPKAHERGKRKAR